MTYENVVLEVATLTALEEVNEAVSNTEIEQSVSEVVIEETKTLATQVSNIQKAPITKTAKVVQVQQAVKKFEAKTGAKVVKASTTSTTTNTAPAAAPTKVAQAPKKEKKATTIAKQIISSTAKKETINEKKEKQEEKKSEVKEEKQEEKQEKKKIVSKTTSSSKSKVSTIDAAMAKVDEVVKDIAKNLEVKNLVKLEAMKGDISLALYTNTEFYKSRDIYLNNNMFDNREIYNNINLVQYIENDPVAQKEKILKDLRLRERELLFKLEALKNG